MKKTPIFWKLKILLSLQLLFLSIFCPVLRALGAEMQLLRNHVPRSAKGLIPVNHLAATNRLNLAISLPLRNPEALTNLLRDLYDPASPNYRHYLATGEFTSRFGPTEPDAAAVSAFARSNGLAVTAIHPNRMIVDVNGSVADIEKALHVKLSEYQHPTENRTFYAPDVEPSLDLAVPIMHISGLDNYSLPRPRIQISPLPLDQSAAPNAGSGPGNAYLGKDFRAAYVPDSSRTGTGQIVGLLQFDGYTPSDITYYENLAQLPNVTLTNVLLDGYSGTPTGTGGEIEVSLDIEMTISMAPGLAEIIVYEAGPFGNWHDILNRMANDNLAKQISCSWYIPDGPADPVADQIFQQMAAQGQSCFAASGDYHAYTGQIPFPGDTPYITEVGGTFLTTTTSGGPYTSETVWNRGNGIGTGGGISTQYSIPGWQTNINMTANLGSTTRRNTPDVALTADNVYVRADGFDQRVGGTSCAAPLWAGFTALVNQTALASGRPPVGFINPAVDAIGSGPKYASCFHDINTGNNEGPGTGNKFPGVTGYDLCTGWGTPAGQALINALANPEALLITPETGFVSIGGMGGPFTIAAQSLTLTNTGTNSLNWILTNLPVWLTASPTSGTLTTNGPATVVAIGLNSAASNLAVGTYSATVWFTNLNDNFGQSRSYTLNIISPPTIISQPTNLAVLDGDTALFTVAASGGLPLIYQWQFNGTNVADGGNYSGSSSSNLTIANVSATNVGAYSVIVSNAAKTITSSNALLTITPSAPVITLQPTNKSVVMGRNVQFAVAALGSKPFSFQWSFGTTNIAGATNATLTLTNVQFNQAGNYAVIVSNNIGATPSSNAVLTVLAVPPCDPPAPGLVSWWRAEDNTLDTEGTNDATPQGNLTYAPGEVHQAFQFDGFNAFLISPASATLNVGTGAGFTVECWINPTSATKNMPLWEWNSGAQTIGTHFWISEGGSGIPGGPGSLYANLIDSSGISHPFASVTNLIRSNSFQHVALTYDQASGVASLYYNGTNVASQNLGSFTPQTTFPVYIGRRPYYNSAEIFSGLMDEVSLYNRALSAAEIQAIFNADISGKCFVPTPPSITSQPTNLTVAIGSAATFTVTAAGTAPLTYQWLFNLTNTIPGATKAALIVPDVQMSNAGFYSVLVSNASGSQLSSNAMLTVVPAPPCLPPPAGLTSSWQGEGNTLDTAGTNNAAPQGNLTYAAGEVGQAFKFDGSTAFLISPASATLNVGTGSGFTIECWIEPTSPNKNMPLWEWNTGGPTIGTHFWISEGGSGYPGGPGSLYANLIDTGGNSHIFASPLNLITTNGFQHVALTYDQASGVASLYYNGTNVASQTLGTFSPQTTFPVYIGRRPYFTATEIFSGLMDEISLYSRALSSTEIQAIYHAGVSGKCFVPTPPMITSQPTNQTVPVGSTVAFTVTASGAPPLTYQWLFNLTNTIPGATNATLILPEVQMSNAGFYSVLVSNALSSQLSSNAMLTVVPPPSCLPLPPNLVSWWRGEDNTSDTEGTNNAAPQGNLTYAPGEVGQTFNFDGSTAFLISPASVSLNVGSGSGFTIECWIEPTSATKNMPLWEWNTGGPTIGTHFWISEGGSGNPGGLGCLYANLIDTGGTSHAFASPLNLITTNGFQHVALTYDQASGVASLYYNGTNVASQSFGSFNPQTSYPVYIGRRPYYTTTEIFSGLMDEISLYGRALSATEIQAIFKAGVSGKCFVPTPPVITSQPTNLTVPAGSTATFTVTTGGSPPLTYQWMFNVTHKIPGATNASLVLTNTQLTNAGYYSVEIANSVGSTSSRLVSLAVTTPTLCDPPPSGLTSWWQGEGNTLDAGSTNNAAPQSRWQPHMRPGEVGQAFAVCTAAARS